MIRKPCSIGWYPGGPYRIRVACACGWQQTVYNRNALARRSLAIGVENKHLKTTGFANRYDEGRNKVLQRP